MTPPRPTTMPERLAALEASITHTHELIQDMHARLFGNGQPGELQRLDTRVRALEKIRWKLAGAFVACSGLGTAAGVMVGLLVHWWKK